MVAKTFTSAAPVRVVFFKLYLFIEIFKVNKYFYDIVRHGKMLYEISYEIRIGYG